MTAIQEYRVLDVEGGLPIANAGRAAWSAP